MPVAAGRGRMITTRPPKPKAASVHGGRPCGLRSAWRTVRGASAWPTVCDGQSQSYRQIHSHWMNVLGLNQCLCWRTWRPQACMHAFHGDGSCVLMTELASPRFWRHCK